MPEGPRHPGRTWSRLDDTLDPRLASRVHAVRRMRQIGWLPAILLTASIASAQDAPQGKPPDKPEERPTGLPSPLKWTFNFDAGWGTFGFANSLYINPRDPGTNQDLSDQWFEGFVKPALSGVYVRPSSSELYGKISAVGERTYGAVPSAFGQDVSSFGPEDLYVGWRSGKSLSIGENAIDLTAGRVPFKLGHGFLLYDGASEGGSRGGYWTNARKAFEFGAIGRIQPGRHKLETFYLDRDELQESDTGSRLWGVNYEITAGQDERHDDRRHLHAVAGACGRQAGPRRIERLQPARVHGAVTRGEGSDVRARVCLRAQWRRAQLECVDRPGCVSMEHGGMEADALVPSRIFRG